MLHCTLFQVSVEPQCLIMSTTEMTVFLDCQLLLEILTFPSHRYTLHSTWIKSINIPPPNLLICSIPFLCEWDQHLASYLSQKLYCLAKFLLLYHMLISSQDILLLAPKIISCIFIHPTNILAAFLCFLLILLPSLPWSF